VVREEEGLGVVCVGGGGGGGGGGKIYRCHLGNFLVRICHCNLVLFH